MHLDSDITLSQRYECKYLVSPVILPAVREFLAPFTRPDPFAAMHEGYRYPICSLYLDTDDLRLYQQTVGGEKNRFKLRIRTYSDAPETPVFFEVKSKVNSIVRKRRARLGRERAAALLRHGFNGYTDGLAPGLVEDVEYFAHHVALAAARPFLRVRYLREAYESQGGDPVRITVDTDLMHALTLENELSHTRGRWVGTPLDGAIIEIKFTDRFPPWVQDLVRAFGLKQQPVPKYCLSVDHIVMEGREATMAFAGFTLPPRRA